MTEELAQSKALLAETKARIAAIKQARRDAAELTKTTVALAEALQELEALESVESFPAAESEVAAPVAESEPLVETGEVDYSEELTNLAHAG